VYECRLRVCRPKLFKILLSKSCFRRPPLLFWDYTLLLMAVVDDAGKLRRLVLGSFSAVGLFAPAFAVQFSSVHVSCMSDALDDHWCLCEESWGLIYKISYELS